MHKQGDKDTPTALFLRAVILAEEVPESQQAETLSRGGLDPRVPRFNQGVTGLLLLVAFLFDLRLLVPLVGLILGLGATFGIRWNLWAQVFLHVVKPVFHLGPPKTRKDPAPTRFALSLGTVFLAAATAALFLLPTTAGLWVGWILALAVAALALLAAVTDICVGCWIHTTLVRLRRTDTATEPAP